MPDDDLLERYLASARPSRGGQQSTPSAAHPPVEAEPDPLVPAADDLGCFGHLRGVRERAVMLELRRRTGDALAIAYGFIDRILFDPSDGITIHAGGQTVRILGENLNAEVRPNVRLFEGLTRHRVAWVAEAAKTLDTAGSTGVNVRELTW